MAHTILPRLPTAEEITKRLSGQNYLLELLQMRSLDCKFWMDDFDGDAVLGEWATLTNGAGAVALAVSNDLLNGVGRMTTGTALSGYSGASLRTCYRADMNCVVACRLQLSAITTVKCEVGFTDAVGDAGAVNALGNDGAAATFTATDAAVWAVDRDTSSALWQAVGVDSGTVATKINPTSDQVGPAAATYETLIVALQEYDVTNRRAAAKFIRLNSDGHLTYESDWMREINSGGISSDILLTPWVFVQARAASASRDCDIDYLAVWQSRA